MPYQHCHCENNMFSQLFKFNLFSNMMNKMFVPQTPVFQMPVFQAPTYQTPTFQMPQTYPQQSVFNYTNNYTNPFSTPVTPTRFQQPVFDYSNIFSQQTTTTTQTTTVQQPAIQSATTRTASTASNTTQKSTPSSLKASGVVCKEVNGYKVNTFRYTNLQGLRADMKEKVVAMSKKAEQLGYTMVISDGFRSHEQQATAKKKKPTLCAAPGKSAHEYGAAIDIALYDKNGKQISVKYVKEFANYATQTLGLGWGQNWQSKKEDWHFELANYRNLPEYRSYNGLA